jgi:4-alpha-glucanotransferase
VVAGVPPDYFSPTGQLWGNPLYRWDVHAETGYAWWIERFRAVLRLVDIVRVDHFRGFAGYWEIPASSPTAETGRWVPGPGAPFFKVLQQALGTLPIIAEDLGIITPDVVELREAFDLPGMKVLLFAFGSKPSDLYLPHNYVRNCVGYTGTHDNDTTVGWFSTATEAERQFCLRYLNRNGKTIAWDLIRLLWESVDEVALAPMQDFLSLGSDARMNFPGTLGGNWSWRMPEAAFDKHLCSQIQEMKYLYSRNHSTETE